jgi:hypothetical protein
VVFESIDDGPESGGILEERGDVVEQNAGFGEVRHTADELFEMVHEGKGIVAWGRD